MQRTPLAQKRNRPRSNNPQPPARLQRARGTENRPVGPRAPDKEPTAPPPQQQQPPPPATPAASTNTTNTVVARNSTQQEPATANSTQQPTGDASDTDIEDEAAEATQVKRSRVAQLLKYEAANVTEQDLNALFKIGRLGGRLCIPFSRFEQVFHFGATFEPDLAAGFKFNLAHRCAWEWKTIKEAFPALQDLLDRLDKDYVVYKLNYYRGQTRGEDVLRLKNLVLDLFDWTPAIPRAQAHLKNLRGFSHAQMAQMLLPPTEDFYNPETAQAYRSGDKRLSPLVFPRFLFPSDDPLELQGPAFLKNEDLPRCAQGVVLGRQGALAGDRVASGNSLTNKHQFRFVTPPFMAYICCLFRFAISSETSFALAGNHGFQYSAFYHRILKTLIGIAAMGPDGNDELNELMSWWEERIWGVGNAADDDDQPVEEQEELTNTPDDVIARYREHIAKKRRLADGEAEPAT